MRRRLITHEAEFSSRTSDHTSSPIKDELLGRPVLPNDIALSKIHHGAFHAHLSGSDSDYRAHVSDRLLSRKDMRFPMLGLPRSVGS